MTTSDVLPQSCLTSRHIGLAVVGMVVLGVALVVGGITPTYDLSLLARGALGLLFVAFGFLFLLPSFALVAYLAGLRPISIRRCALVTGLPASVAPVAESLAHVVADLGSQWSVVAANVLFPWSVWLAFYLAVRVVFQTTPPKALLASVGSTSITHYAMIFTGPNF